LQLLIELVFFSAG